MCERAGIDILWVLLYGVFVRQPYRYRKLGRRMATRAASLIAWSIASFASSNCTSRYPPELRVWIPCGSPAASGQANSKIHRVLGTGTMRKRIPVIVGIVVLTVMLWLIATLEFTSWDFRNNLWAPTHLLWRGESAYDIGSVFPRGNAIWFPQIVGVFFPLGMMPLPLATGVWLGMSVVALVALTWYLSWQVAQQKPSPWAFGVLSLAVLLFAPTIRHLILGQADLILIVTMVAGVYALERDRLALSALLFAITLAKPQLCIIVLPTAIVHFYFCMGGGGVL